MRELSAAGARLDALLMLVVPVFASAGTFDWDPRGGTPDDAWNPMLAVISLSGLCTGVLSRRRELWHPAAPPPPPCPFSRCFNIGTGRARQQNGRTLARRL